jgi:tryptophan halogenase
MKKILVIGGGAAGYFAALRYKSKFKNYQVDLIQSKNINIIGVGESSILDLPDFLFNRCELDITEFHREVKPTFKLGLQTREWSKAGKYINYTNEFIHLAYKYGLDILDNMEDKSYSLFSILMENKKPPITKKRQLIVNNQKEVPFFHAYQIENKKFIPYLKQQAQKKGINEIEGEITNIQYENNSIKKIYFNENYHQYDFYIDCSGFGGCITKFIKNDWFSFKEYMPCDSVILGEHELLDTPNNYSVAHAMTNGWMFQIDCYGRTGKGYVYNSSTISEEMATEEYLLKNKNLVKKTRKISFNPGYYKNIFGENYCLIGNCAGFAEPLEASGYSVIISSIELLLKNHLNKENLSLTRTEIKNNNLFLTSLWKEIINIILMHYKFNDNYQNPFWNYCKNLNFIGDFNEVVDYMKENKFFLYNIRELKNNYFNSIIFPIEIVYCILKSKDIIKKNPNNLMISTFKEKSKEIMTYNEAYESDNFEEYFTNKITLDEFLN